MGHGTAAHLASLDLLAEVLHGDVLPEVAVHVDDDGVYALHGIEDGTEGVVVAYLGGVFLSFESQFITQELLAELVPIAGGVCHVVGIEVARCTTELGGDGTSLEGI